jgi:hypothetical protein
LRDYLWSDVRPLDPPVEGIIGILVGVEDDEVVPLPIDSDLTYLVIPIIEVERPTGQKKVSAGRGT